MHRVLVIHGDRDFADAIEGEPSSYARKLKRSGGLGGIPVMILSSDENADGLFEQHRQTRSMAQDYVGESIDGAGLVERISRVAPARTTLSS